MSAIRKGDDRWTLIRANAHLHRRGEVLADFETALIREAHDRVVLAQGAPMTAEERRVVVAAMDAMVSAGGQDLTEAGLAA